MVYKNPIILSDYSDPDVIKYNDSYYLVASSFNHTPILPILKSKNLVDFKILRYVDENLPFKRFKNVYHGEGAWAPSIRFFNNKFYIIVPYPDEGIWIYETSDIEKGKFKSWPLILGKGIIDPCPIWTDDKCYLVVGFAKSRIGFNSMLGLYEVTPDLKKCISDTYKIIYDGHNDNPTIEGPKFYYRNNYYYILAPAGSVKTGWQTALRSKNIYGPYESKVVMMQNDSKINGPHQGALVELDETTDVFYHFQDLGPYGRVVLLEPVKWVNDWPLIGEIKDELLGGSPVESYPYFINKKSNYKIQTSDKFNRNKISLMWQTPANKDKSWFTPTKEGLILNIFNNNDLDLNLIPNSLLTKITFYSFEVKTKAILNLLNNHDETGLCYMGKTYAYISVKIINKKKYLLLSKGEFNKKDKIIKKIPFDNNEIIFKLKYTYPNKYQLGYNDFYFDEIFEATCGRWIGGKYGIFVRGTKTGGSSKYTYFEVNDETKRK